MPKFKVYLQQYVEEIAVMQIEATDEDEARAIAKTKAPEADWQDGGDSHSVDVYQVADAGGKIVWSR